jgi:uncharacterized protein DUF3592
MPLVAPPALSPARKTTLRILRWLSLPLAAFVVAGAAWTTVKVYQQYSGKVLTQARIIDSTLTRAGKRGLGTEYNLYVEYRVGNRAVHNNIRVMVNSFRSMRPGNTIELFVDPETGQAQQDVRLAAWFGLLLAAAGATILVLICFVAAGRMLRST